LVLEFKSDWVLWMDADDEVTPEAAAAIKRSLYLPYDIYGFPIQTGPSTRHIHHRLWRSKLHVRYHGAVHEYPSWPVSARVREWGAPIIHHNEPGSGESGIKRNMRILEREIGENPSHRVIFYLANTYRDAYGLEKDKTFLFKALDLYRKYIAAPGSFHDELMFCYIYAARCLRWLGQIEALRQVVREGAAKDATFAELYMEAAFAEYNVGRYWEAISWALQATQCPYKLRLFAERNMYEDQPFRLLAWSFKLLKDPISSLSWGEKVWDYVREDSSWKDFLATILATMKPKSNVVNIHRPGAIGDILALGPTTAGLKALGYKVNLYTAYPEAAKLLSGLTVPDHTWDQRPEGNDLELCGYPIEEGYPHVPMKKPLTTYFCEEAGRKLGLYLDPIYGNGLKSSYERLIDAPYLTFHIKTGWSIYKEWWICNWLALITKLKEAYPSLALVQIGGVDDPKLPIRQETGKTLAHAVGLIKHADLHLGVDSFSNHAAGLLGVPAVILFGSTSPIGSGYPTADNIWANLPCSPCYKENPELSRQSLGPCPHKHECMSSITVDMVFSVVQKRLSEGK
jgi:tetratricopeptide (TPR) repeat protein